MFNSVEIQISCVQCKSNNVEKNGTSYSGKQNYICKDCSRQFMTDGQGYIKTNEQKERIKRLLLLERNSLRTICRMEQVTLSWLQAYAKSLFAEDNKKGLQLTDGQKRPKRGEKALGDVLRE